MKCHDTLQAYHSRQAHSKHLMVYVQIKLSEQGKVADDSFDDEEQ